MRYRTMYYTSAAIQNSFNEFTGNSTMTSLQITTPNAAFLYQHDD